MIRRLPDNAAILQNIANRLTELGLQPFVATEIEFYLEGATEKVTDVMFPDCYKKFGAAGILTHTIEEETAENQFEVSLVHLPDPIAAARNTMAIKDIIESTADDYNLKADFGAKPFEDRPGSGLHVHVSLYDEGGQNVFQKSEDGHGEESVALKSAVAGLCELMAESMVYFAPNEESYARYTADFDEQGKYNHAPVNISWGGNNRTVAVRIPTSTVQPESRHLEHRVAGADADPYLVISAILAGIHHGIENNLELQYDKIWGNAFDKQYDLTDLPKTLKEAKKLAGKGIVLKGYFI